MKLVSYLDRKLKDDAVIELLEHYDMEIIYQFDHLHENTVDAYSSSARSAGFELRFNENQTLKTIWCYVKARDGFTAVDASIVGVPFYSSFKDALYAAEMSGVRTSRSPSGNESWIRLEDRLWRHYEFLHGKLALVTLMLP